MLYRRNPDVRETEVEGNYFLVEPASGEIYYLEEISSGVWRLLDEPRGRDECLDVLKAAFPDTPVSRIVRDLDQALTDMLDGGLISCK
jgi:hypothetical protein